MADEILMRRDASADSGRGVAAVGTIGGFAALFSGAACCVLPLAFSAVGLGAGGLAAFVPYHWPLTIASAVAVAVGWALYVRKRRTFGRDAICTVAPSRTTFVMLSVATAFIAVSALWPSYFEPRLMRLFGGA